MKALGMFFPLFLMSAIIVSVAVALSNGDSAPPQTAPQSAISTQCVEGLEELSNELHFQEQEALAEESGALPESEKQALEGSIATGPVKERLGICLEGTSIEP